tara:strand:+ start:789 stop:1094 length:306 start_codon:yes stop_codon:yes gene_type:complete
MPLYEADGTKQKPIARTGTAFYSHANCPPAQTIVKRPSYVIVNNAGNFSFAYESGSYPSTYITGSVLDADAGPIRLDISPVAWGGTGVKTGDITFVYVRVS